MKLLGPILTAMTLISLSYNTYAATYISKNKAEALKCAIAKSAEILAIPSQTTGVKRVSQLNGVFGLVKYVCVTKQGMDLTDVEIKRVVHGIAISYLGYDNGAVMSFAENHN